MTPGPMQDNRPPCGNDGGCRERRPLFLSVVYGLHAAWFVLSWGAYVMRHAFEFVTVFMERRLSDTDFMYDVFVPFVRACVDVDLMLASVLFLTALSAFWTWVYARVTHMEVRPAVVHGIRLSTGAKWLFGYGCVSSACIIGLLCAHCAMFWDETFESMSGAGPVIGILMGPLVYSMFFAGMALAVTFACAVVPGWKACGRMIRYMSAVWTGGRETTGP